MEGTSDKKLLGSSPDQAYCRMVDVQFGKLVVWQCLVDRKVGEA